MKARDILYGYDREGIPVVIRLTDRNPWSPLLSKGDVFIPDRTLY
jgi:hypothetical protein